METKLDKKRMEKVQRRCGFEHGIEVEAEGSRGGLCMAWKKKIVVNLRSFPKWQIDVLIKEDKVEEEWRYTGFYGPPYLKDKNSIWNLLKRLAQEIDHPWLVEGDFNEILYSFEKCGGIPRDSKLMEAFRETLVECQLFDIGFSGVCFTWERGNLPETNIRERLDRGLQMRNGLRKFHFEAWWTMEESLEKVICESWEANEGTLLEKLGKLQPCLQDWSRTISRNKEGLKRKLLKELEALAEGKRDDDTLAKLIDTKIHLNLEIDKDEVY
ncbi:Exo_endo_phos domain-containing protein [Gossypium australe]|uniref:Exo_endo_phos domain-containing protein n=1 Tax=Gossypium australe TaxID=47621 RepID=A0A5B6V7M5_9ROSI|nr:Exo_endo_phos domain-containing protein [Gossypium australe]